MSHWCDPCGRHLEQHDLNQHNNINNNNYNDDGDEEEDNRHTALAPGVVGGGGMKYIKHPVRVVLTCEHREVAITDSRVGC